MSPEAPPGVANGETPLHGARAANPVAAVVEVASGTKFSTGKDMTVSDYAWAAAGMFFGPLDFGRDLSKIDRVRDLRKSGLIATPTSLGTNLCSRPAHRGGAMSAAVYCVSTSCLDKSAKTQQADVS